MSALLYTLAAFALILILARLKLPLSAAILVGAIVAGALFGLGPVEILQALWAGLIDPQTIVLALVTAILLTLSDTMRTAGQLKTIVALTGALLRWPVASMAVLPALVGLIPMPGGAVFSAPMVKTAAGDANVDGATLSAANYWYRHIWEYWSPLYPGVILASTLVVEGSLWTFTKLQLPLGVFMVVSGLPILLHAHRSLALRPHRVERGTVVRLIVATSSIWLIMLVWAVGSLVLRLLPAGAVGDQAAKLIRKFLPVAAGLLLSLAWTVILNRMRATDVAAVLKRRNTYVLVVVVVAVMIFKSMLGQAGAANGIAEDLQQLHVPIAAVAVVLPFIAGLVMGIAIGFVGASFPLVLALVRDLPGEPAVWPYVALAYASGHLGMMLSPLHVCHVVSNRYFGTSFGPVYRRLLAPAALQAVLASGYAALLWLLLGR